LTNINLALKVNPDQWRPYNEGPKVAEYLGR
jgi:hypothetical protein